MIIPDHFVQNPGASEDAIAQAQAALGGVLPQDYLDFLRISNGGESGDGPVLILWPIEDVPTFGAEYLEAVDIDHVVLFGSNGGGEAFGFDLRQKPTRIVELPFIGMEWRFALHCADSWEAFLQHPTGFER